MITENREWHESAHQEIDKYLVRQSPYANRPGNPGSNQRYFANDLGITFLFNGAIWLSEQIFLLPIIPRDAQPIAQGTRAFDTGWEYSNFAGGTIFGNLRLKFFSSTAQSNVNYYTASVTSVSTTGVQSAVTIGGTTTTQGATSANTWYGMPITFPGGAQFGTTIDQLTLTLTPTGAPGSFFLNGGYAMRLVGA